MSGATIERAGASEAGSSGRVIHRFEVRGRVDPRGEVVRREAGHVGVHPTLVRTARVYWIAGVFTDAQLERIGSRLLADPVLEEWRLGAAPVEEGEELIEVHPLPGVMDPAAQTVRESVAEMVGGGEAQRHKGTEAQRAEGEGIEVVTGWRYDVAGVSGAEAEVLARGLLANEVIEAVRREAWWPREFPHAAAADQRVRHVPIRGLDDAALGRLSREGHLFLSLEEMRAIRAEYERFGREPTDVELETLAQTWSEHCVHKTLKSTIRITPPPGDIIDWSNRPGHEVMPDGSVVIHNLLRSTVAAATHELIEEGCDWALSVFVDNAGVIAFDEEHAVCVKVETHNHPSAIEPYGGAATGIGGVIRDIMGTGLGAKPVACTDVFCVAYPDHFTAETRSAQREDRRFTTEGTEDTERGLDQGAEADRHSGSPRTQPSPSVSSSVSSVPSVVQSSLSGRDDGKRRLPAGCLDPRRVLMRVVDGVRDYGNRMGIPTVNGTVWFDDRFVGNPLVFAGCVGVMPRRFVRGEARAGDVIVAIGGRTGRDGIHGATFSSAELTDTHADEFSHAVQIGNAIEEKRTLDALLRARDHERGCLYSGVTDCGAGGFSSAVGEMGEKLGAEVHLDRAPLKYAGLRYDEIWISESQERMVLAVARENLAALRRICAEERVEMAELGVFGVEGEDGPELVLRYEGEEVGRMGMRFLHEGLPMGVREARWEKPVPAKEAESPQRAQRGDGGEESQERSVGSGERERAPDVDVKETLLDLLAHPNIASKRWIVRQYDHEVQGATVLKPLVGPGGIGPGDAAVIQPVPGSKMGLAIACGLAIPVGDPHRGGDPYLMALAAVDECVRNLVCVGANPDRIAILDNFCWASCAKPENLGALVRAAEGCYDAAKAYRTPFISGKDSLNNQFRTGAGGAGEVIEIPPTLLITGVGVVEDVSKCVTMDLKPSGRFGESLYLIGGVLRYGLNGIPLLSTVQQIERRRAGANLVAELIRRGWAAAVHDCSEGGLLVAVAEMLIAAQSRGTGVHLFGDDFLPLDDSDDLDPDLPAYTPCASSLGFCEQPGMYVVQIDARSRGRRDEMVDLSYRFNADANRIGEVNTSGSLKLTDDPEYKRAALDVPVADLRAAFLGSLDW